MFWIGYVPGLGEFGDNGVLDAGIKLWIICSRAFPWLYSRETLDADNTAICSVLLL